MAERIYEAAVVPELWPDIFEELALRTDSALGSMFAMRAAGRRWGASIEALADALGVAHETVRTKLKAVLAKTGVTRQVELANLRSGLALPG